MHSHYSFGRATASPGDLVAAAARRGVQALALTDLESLHAAPEFVAAAKRQGIHPVLGLSLPDPTVPASEARGRAVVLARTGAGYAELCALVAERTRFPERSVERLLMRLTDQVWILSPDIQLLLLLRRRRGPGFLAAELRAGAPWQRLAARARDLRLPSVATAAITRADAGDLTFQRLLFAAHQQLPIERLQGRGASYSRSWMLDAGAMCASFSSGRDPLLRANEIAHDCQVDLQELTALSPAAERQLYERLRGQLHGSLRRRLTESSEGPLDSSFASARAALDTELDRLCRWRRLEALELLLTVTEQFGRFGFRPDIPSYLLGSWALWAAGLGVASPAQMKLDSGLLWGKEQLPERPLDLLVPRELRAPLLDALTHHLGPASLVRSCRLERWTGLSAARAITRSRGGDIEECDRLVALLPTGWEKRSLDECLARSPRLRGSGLEERPWPSILRDAARLDGVPRTTRPAEELLFLPRGLANLTPIGMTPGGRCAQWTTSAAWALGLAAPSFGTSPAQEVVGPTPLRSVDPSVVVSTDPVGCSISGSSLGLPGSAQLASSGPPPASGRVPAEHFAEDLLERFFGGQSSDTPRSIERAALYEALVGPSRPTERAELRRSFVRRRVAQGDPRGVALRDWETLVELLPRASMRSTMLALQLDVQRVRERRRREPAAFIARFLQLRRVHQRPALGAGQLDEIPLHESWVYVRAARAWGLSVRLPCVQRGAESTAGSGSEVTVGLDEVRGLRAGSASRIVTERGLGDFQSLDDFHDRLGLSVEELDSLLRAGALDGLLDGHSRASVRAKIRSLRPAPKRSRGGRSSRQTPGIAAPGMTQSPSEVPLSPAGAPWDDRPEVRARDEFEALGFSVCWSVVDGLISEADEHQNLPSLDELFERLRTRSRNRAVLLHSGPCLDESSLPTAERSPVG